MKVMSRVTTTTLALLGVDSKAVCLPLLKERREASAIFSTMIANAIRADTDWFWFGPDA